MARRLAAVALAATLASGCTIGFALTGAGVTGVHNTVVDHSADKWSYTAPVLIGAAIGLVVDILIMKELSSMWSKPMT